MARGGDEEIFRRNVTLLESAAANLAVLRTGVYHEAALSARQKNDTLTPDEIGMKVGMIAAAVFPLIGIGAILFIRRYFAKNG